MIEVITPEKNVLESTEFDHHKSVVHFIDEKVGLEGYIAIHRKSTSNPSFGATRIWQYVNNREALDDGLRLSRMMSYKAALAELACGGAKGVIISPTPIRDRTLLLHAYAEQINYLNSQFITGTDVGMAQNDLVLLKEKSPYIVGFNDNTTDYTARGVYHSMKTCLRRKYGTDEIVDRCIAIQGLGKIGAALISLLSADGAQKIYVSDIDATRVTEIKRIYAHVIPVSPEKIYEVPCDIFAPCALSHSFNHHTVPFLQCAIIVGGANNQLENDTIGVELYKKDILYAPDYVVNAGGLISVYDEYSNKVNDTNEIFKKVLRIEKVLQDIFDTSDREGKATNIVANEKAEKIFNAYT